MYQIFSDNVCIYDDTSPDLSLKLVNPSWMQNANAAGSLEFSVPVTNAGYDSIKRLKSTIHLYKNDVEIWRGRVIQERKDFFNNRAITCEGALAFLNDTVIFLLTPQSSSAHDVLAAILTAHNTKQGLPDSRKVYLGTVGSGLPTENCTIDTSGGTKTFQAVSKLVNDYGGVLRTRIGYNEDEQADVVYLDWLEGYVEPQNPQSIEFGENLLDYSSTQDDTEYYTVLHAKGRVSDPPAYEEQDVVITVTAAQSVINEYGVIEGIEDLSEYAGTSAALQTIAAKYLSDRQYAGLTLDISALDLHVLNPDIRPFELLDKVTISSWAHGMSSSDFAITGITTPLDDPSRSTFTIGSSNITYYRKATKFTQRAADAKDVEDGIDEATREAADYTDEKAEEVAEQAANNLADARTAIVNKLNAGTRGYVTIDYVDSALAGGTDGIYITDEKLPTADSENYETIADRIAAAGVNSYWAWTQDGLAFWKKTNGQWSYTVAITNDGKIDAGMILTGMLLADYIKLYGNLSVYSDAQAQQAGGYIGYGHGVNYDSTTYGIHMYVEGNNDTVSEMIVTNGGARISHDDHHLVVDSDGVIVGQQGTPCDLYVWGDIIFNGQSLVEMLAALSSSDSSNSELADLIRQMQELLYGEEEP